MSKETSIHLMYGPTLQIDENYDSVDGQYGTVRLVGFQNRKDVQHVSLFADDWVKNPAAALGKYPVFSRGEAGIYSWELKVTVVHFNGERFRNE